MTENTRNIGLVDESAAGLDQAAGFARSLAVVIGIDDYAAPIPRLKTPGNDARGIQEVLEKQQQFTVLPPLTEDVTRSRLLELFTVTLPGLNLGPSDRLLVYFAGHGTELAGAGGEPEYYLVPQDARPDDRESFLPMRVVRDALLKLQCRHLLLVLDCCFAGGFGRMRSLDELPPKIYKQRFDFYVSSPAWQVIASAAHDETALDTAGGCVFGRRATGAEAEHSPFASALLDALAGQADVNPAPQEGEPAGDGLITATELHLWVRDRVQDAAGETHRQSPGLWPLPNHEAGEFVFRNPERALALEDALPLTAGTNPYRGLNSYDEAQSHLFFGRKQPIAALAAKVAAEPFVAVLGVSGTGKSSLAKAGLIPALGGSHRAGDPPEPRPVGEARWLTLPPFRPAAEPVASLSGLLTEHLPTYLNQAPPLATDATALAALVTAWRADHPGARLAVVIDQFEELVTLCADKAQRQHFQALLANALAAAGDALRVIITLRTDFEPQFNQGVLKPFWRNEARYVVLPMSQDELRQVILGPAWASEIYFESRALVDELINEVVQAPGGLPLLSFALSKMYLHYIASGRQDRTLRQADFDAVGGVIGSLRAAANAIWDGLDPARQATMERLMLRMIAVGGGEVARRRVTWAELDYGEPENTRRDAVIGQLEEARLVVRDKGADWVEPAHDALVSGWDRLTEWKFKAASYLPLQRDLAPAALRWQAADARARASLLWDDDPRLPQVEETLWPTDGKGKGVAGRFRWARQVLAPKTTAPADTKWLNRPELGFTEASVSRRASTFRRIIGITAAVMIVLAGLAIIAGYQASQATQQRNVAVTAEAKAARSAQAEATAAADARQKQAKAEREGRRARSEELATYARERLRNLGAADPATLILAIDAVSTTLKADGVVTTNAGNVLQEAIDQAPYRFSLPRWRHEGPVRAVQFDPSGTWIVTGSEDGTAIVWDAASGAGVRLLSGHGGPVNSAAWSPDGKWIVTGSEDGTAKVWDAASGAEQRTLSGHGGAVTSVAWSPGGQWIVTGSEDGTAKVWEAASGAELLTLSGHADTVTAVAWSPDAKWIVTGSKDETAKVWEAASGTKLRTLRGNLGDLTAVAWSPDGKWIAMGSDHGTAKVWDAASGVEQRTLSDGYSETSPVAWSPDGKWIVTLSGYYTAKVWDAASGTELRTLRGHDDKVTSVAWSPGGKWIVTGSEDGTAKVWDAASGTELRTLSGHSGTVYAVAWSPDGKWIVTGSYDGTVKVWDAVSGTDLRTLHGHGLLVTAVAWSPDGKWIVTGSDHGTAKVWDAASGVEQRTLRGHADTVTAVSWSPGGKWIVTGNDDGTAKVWDAASGAEQRTLRGHGLPVASVAWSPDDKWIVAVDGDDTATVWDAASGAELRTLRGHADTVTAVSWSPDGKWIVTGSKDETATVWDAASGTKLRTLRGHELDVTAVAWSPNGRWIVTGSEDGTAKVWDAATGAEQRTLSGHGGAVTSVAWSPGGQWIVTGSEDGTAKVWDAASRAEQHTLSGHVNWVTSVAWSPGGKWIVTGSDDGTAKVWDAVSWTELRTLRGHGLAVASVAWSPDDKWIVAVDGDDTATVWDAANGTELRTLRGHAKAVTAVSWSPGGQWIVTGSEDGTAKVWDAASGTELRTLRGHAGMVTAVAWSPDGKWIVTGSYDGTAKVWDAASGAEQRTLSGDYGNSTLVVAWSPDSKWIVTGHHDRTAKVWDAASGTELRTLRGHGDNVTSVAWSPGGKWIVTGSDDGTAKVWDAASGAEQRTLSGHGGSVTAVAWSPDGKWIVTGNGDSTAKVWLGTPEHLIEAAFSRIGRNAKVLLSDERTAYGYQ